MAEQFVSADPNWSGDTINGGPHIGAPPEDRPVTLGDLKDDPRRALARIGTILKKDASDPKLWIGLAASYFAPKVLNEALPMVARAASQTAKLATPEMAKDLGITALGGSRVNAAIRIANRVRGGAAESVTAPVTVAPSAPASAAPATDISAASMKDFNMSRAMAEVSKMFKATGATPQPAEVNNAASMMRFGKTADEAVARVIAQRPMPVADAAAKLAAKFGTPSDATVAATVAARNARGR